MHDRGRHHPGILKRIKSDLWTVHAVFLVCLMVQIFTAGVRVTILIAARQSKIWTDLTFLNLTPQLLRNVIVQIFVKMTTIERKLTFYTSSKLEIPI